MLSMWFCFAIPYWLCIFLFTIVYDCFAETESAIVFEHSLASSASHCYFSVKYESICIKEISEENETF